MRHAIFALATVAALIPAVTLPSFAAADAIQIVEPSQTIDAKRETCWRTNRSTGQKFRIC